MSDYYLLTVSGVPSHLEEEVSEALFNLGAAGIHENLRFTQEAGFYIPELEKSPVLELISYFENSISDSDLQLLRQKFPQLELKYEQQEERDWMEEWKKGFHPFSLVDNYWVVPSWLKDPENVIPLRIDPGMAFGTGTHETTQLCAKQIYKMINGSTKKDLSLLDVGAGSGILAILAAKLGLQNIVAIEIDPIARETCRENVHLNALTMAIEVLDSSLEQITQKFDVMCANIVDGVLIELKEALLARTAYDGTLLLSGVIDERRLIFEEAFMRDTRLTHQETTQQGEWYAYTFTVRSEL